MITERGFVNLSTMWATKLVGGLSIKVLHYLALPGRSREHLWFMCIFVVLGLAVFWRCLVYWCMFFLFCSRLSGLFGGVNIFVSTSRRQTLPQGLSPFPKYICVSFCVENVFTYVNFLPASIRAVCSASLPSVPDLLFCFAWALLGPLARIRCCQDEKTLKKG